MLTFGFSADGHRGGGAGVVYFHLLSPLSPVSGGILLVRASLKRNGKADDEAKIE